MTTEEFQVRQWWPKLTTEEKILLRSATRNPLTPDMVAAVIKARGMLVSEGDWEGAPQEFSLPDSDWDWIEDQYK